MAPQGLSVLGRRRVSPFPTMAVPPFRALYATGFLGVAIPSSSPLPWPSPSAPRLGSLLAPCGVLIDDAAGFASCCGLVGCTLPRRARPCVSTPRSLRTPAGCYKGALVPPLAGLAPASHRELAGHAGRHFLKMSAPRFRQSETNRRRLGAARHAARRRCWSARPLTSSRAAMRSAVTGLAKR